MRAELCSATRLFQLSTLDAGRVTSVCEPDLGTDQETEMAASSTTEFLERFPFAAVVIDGLLVVKQVNLRAERLLNLSSGDAQGKRLPTLLACQADIDELSRAAAEMTSGGLPCAVLGLCDGDTSDRNRCRAESALILIRQNVEDIEESRLIDTDRILTRGEMAGEIAHEMNNHLTVLFGNVEILPLYCSRNECETVQRKLSLMRSTLEKIAAMSDCLADYGRPQNPRPTSEINNMIAKTIEFMLPQNRFDRIAVEVNLTPNMLPAVVDLGRLQQAFSDILHNAADELRLGKVENPKVKVSSRVCTDDQSIEIEVEDNGRGFTEDVLSRVFKERVTTKPSGEGLGLLACNKIMKDQGGAVLIDSQAGKGTKVILTIPIASVNQATADVLADDVVSNRTAPAHH